MRTPTLVPEGLTPRGELESYRNLTHADRARMLAAACRAAARLLRSRPDARRATDFADPLPESSILILARLRASAAARRSVPEATQRARRR